MSTPDTQALAQNALSVYQQGNFKDAARLFGEAALLFESQGKLFDAAEMRNNQSVSLLQCGDAQGSFKAAHDTAQVFAAQGDFRREGMAFGNEATALVAMGRLKDAVPSYRSSAVALEKAGEDQLRASIMQALAGVQLRQGKVMEAMLSMKIGMAGVRVPTLKQKFLRLLLSLLR